MRALSLRRETHATRSGGSPFRVLFASDLHLGLPWTRRVPERLVAAVDATRPDVVLLGGDLLDGPHGRGGLRPCVAALARRAPVLARPGNHDVAAGVARVRAEVLAGGGVWLPDEPRRCERRDGPPILCAASDDALTARGDEVGVVCGHDPAEVAKTARGRAEVAFAGHLHGGQIALWTRGGRFYPAAWFFRYAGPRFDLDGLRLFVSVGVADTVPFRWNCPREALVCDFDGDQAR